MGCASSTGGGSGSPIRYADGPNLDAFARLRVSSPFTLFDSRQVFDSQPLFWDDVQASGAGTTSTHNANQASTTLLVANVTAGRRVRQTKQRFTYEPGKSQAILMTVVLGAAASGITESVGWGDDSNGIFWRCIDGVLTITRRTFTSGAAVDEDVAQADWNLDRLDGTGHSGVTINATLTQLLIIDAEWLGVGRVRLGFFFDGQIVYAHEFLNANAISLVYMSSSTLPLQYSIENDGAGPETTLVTLCSSVQSEGGQQEIGSIRHVSTAAATVNANAVGTYYAIAGLRQKAGQLDSVIKPVSVSLVATTLDAFEWRLILNPTVAGVFTYVNVANSPAQVVVGDTAGNPSTNTVTLGTVIEGGYGAQQSSVDLMVENALYIGSTFAGVVDEIVLAVSPLAINLDIAGALVWRELV